MVVKTILGLSWAILGPSWAILGPSWGHLGPPWGHLGPSWGHLRPSWGHLGAILGPSSASLGQEPTNASKTSFVAPPKSQLPVVFGSAQKSMQLIKRSRRPREPLGGRPLRITNLECCRFNIAYLLLNIQLLNRRPGGRTMAEGRLWQPARTARKARWRIFRCIHRYVKI